MLVIGGDPETPIEGERQLDSLSGTTSHEDYVVPLVVSASISGTDQTAADALALADWAAMEVAIREYPGGADLGLAAQGVLSVLPIGPFTMPRYSTSDGRSTAVKWGIRVRAQNT